MLKRISSFLLALAVFGGITTALADNAGTSSNPLITKSYIDSTIIPELKGSVDRVVSSYAEKFGYDPGSKLVYDQIAGRIIPDEYSVASGYLAVSMPKGGKITVITGGSVLVSFGDVKLTVESGEVIDVSAAHRASEPLSANVRYFAAENTKAVFEAREDAVCLVNGPYMLSGGAELLEDGWFIDIGEYSEYYEIIVQLTENGIINGISKDCFELRSDMTARTMLDAVWTMAGKPGRSAESWAKTAGINSIPYGDLSLTRQEMAFILYRYAVNRGLNTFSELKLTMYEDYYDAEPEYADAVRWALDKKLIQGSIDTVIEPGDIMTRQQAAEAIYKLLNMS